MQVKVLRWREVGVLAVSAALAAGEVWAADPSTYKAPPPPVFSWTGSYIGLNAGGGFSANNAFNTFAATGRGTLSSVLGGIQSGYNYQISPMFVVGYEGDFSATGLSNNAWNSPYVKLPWYGTNRARIGIAPFDPHLLFYGTGGLATGELYDIGMKKFKIGWSAGAGIEWAFRPDWSAKLEYLYTDFNHNGLPDWNHSQFHIIRLGVNYHFDLFR